MRRQEVAAVALTLGHRRGEYGLDGVLIGTDVTTGDDVTVDYGNRVLGVAMIGRSGTGKSSLMEHLILEDIANGTPGLVIDPHGMMADRVISLAPSSAVHRIVLLDPSQGESFGLNLLACREPVPEIRDDPITWAADSVVETVKKLYGEADEYLPRLETYLNRAVRTLIPSGLTLAHAPRLFEDERFREDCLKRVPSNNGWQQKLRRRWRLYSQMRPAEQASHVEAVVNRLERLLDSDLIYSMVSSPTTTVPFDDVLNGDMMLIVRLPHEILGEERCDFIGALLLCAIADRIFIRSLETDPPRVHLYLDEYQRFATTTTRQLLAQGRKFGAGVTLALQDLSHIKDQTVRDACRHVGSLIVLGVTWPDAELLAGEFPIKPGTEWYEEVPLEDGMEPEMIPTSTPGRSANRHRNPLVAAAGRQLFELRAERGGKRTYSWTPHVAVDCDDPGINQLLVDVMRRNIGTTEIRRRVLDILYLFTEGRLTEDADRYSGALAPIDYNVKLMPPSWNEQDCPEVMRALGQWLDVYLQHRNSPEHLRAQVYSDADEKLYEYAAWKQDAERSWNRTEWDYRLKKLVPLVREVEKEERLEYLRCTVSVMGERLHALLVLCDGLASDPIYEASGQLKPRMRKTLVVHPKQPEHDARLELARKLVNPTERPEQYRGHVRLPGGRHHEIDLVAPVSGRADIHQLEEIRYRSSELYVVTDEDESEGPDEPPEDDPPTIGRRSPRA